MFSTLTENFPPFSPYVQLSSAKCFSFEESKFCHVEKVNDQTYFLQSSSSTKKEKAGASGNSNKERMTRTPNRQTGPGSKKERHRKQNNRRYSNKENRIELCIVDKCSSSI